MGDSGVLHVADQQGDGTPGMLRSLGTVEPGGRIAARKSSSTPPIGWRAGQGVLEVEDIFDGTRREVQGVAM